MSLLLAQLVSITVLADGQMSAWTTPSIQETEAQWEWCVDYATAASECWTTPSHTTALAVHRGLRASVRARYGGAAPWGPPSWAFVAGPLPGDLTWDCVVGGPDSLVLGAHYGETCP